MQPLVELSQAGAHLCTPVAHIPADMAHLHQSAQQAHSNVRGTQVTNTTGRGVKLVLVSLQKWWLGTATSHHGLSCSSKNPRYRA